MEIKELANRINNDIQDANWTMIKMINIDVKNILRVVHLDIEDADTSYSYLIELNSLRNRLAELGFYLKICTARSMCDDVYYLCGDLPKSQVVKDLEIDITRLKGIIITLENKVEDYKPVKELLTKIARRNECCDELKSTKKELKELDKEIAEMAEELD